MRLHTKSIWSRESRIYAQGATFQPSSCCNPPIRPSSRAVWRSTRCSCQSVGSASHTGLCGLEAKGQGQGVTTAPPDPVAWSLQAVATAAQRQPQLLQKPPQAGRHTPIGHQHFRHDAHQDWRLGAEAQGQGQLPQRHQLQPVGRRPEPLGGG